VGYKPTKNRYENIEKSGQVGVPKLASSAPSREVIGHAQSCLGERGRGEAFEETCKSTGEKKKELFREMVS